MKKKRIIFSMILIIMINIITISMSSKKFKNKEENYKIETYIDGKLALAFPEANSGLKFKSATCTNGATATFNHSSWRLKIKNSTDKTLCKVEFESNTNKTFNTYLKNKVCSDISSEANTKDCLVNENGYRYEGSDPNNYILFNDELWRIIGVFTMTNSSGVQEDLVKLIRNDTLDGLAWHSSDSNDWNNAALKNTLNNGYLNGTDVTCNFHSSYTKTCYFSKIGIKAGARDKIETVVWNIGGASTNALTAEAMYTAERGTIGAYNSTTSLTWTGKVGLMYASDYGYACLATICPRTTDLASYLYNSDWLGKIWLKYSHNQWTITPSSSNSLVFQLQDAYLNTHYSSNGAGVSPSIYLKSSVRYISGNGTYDSPYVVS